MGAFVRIVSRYLIGGLAVYLPMSGLTNELLGSEEAMLYVDGAIVIVASTVVEGFRRLAIKYGWSL